MNYTFNSVDELANFIHFVGQMTEEQKILTYGIMLGLQARSGLNGSEKKD